MGKIGKERMFGGWSLGRELGKGGNAQVFQASKESTVGAIKVLTHFSGIRPDRFRDEIEAMTRCADIPGVLPVLDFNVPEMPSRGTVWLVMGLAIPIQHALGLAPTLRRVVEAVRDIAHTLEQMHIRNITHRDIKPENLFFFEKRWAVGDFGLANFEGKSAKTVHGERIGPIYYIAPEMLNDALNADGRPADVFSLTKTLWVLATGQRFPLPGAYDLAIDAFRIGSYVAEGGSGPLDKLIAAGTAFDPSKRPKMIEVVTELDSWLQPAPLPAPAILLDISPFAAKLEARKSALDTARNREKQDTERSEVTGLRIRESLRPLANDIESSLRTANFHSTSLGIDNWHWGFEVRATVLGDGDFWVRLIIKVTIAPELPKVTVCCRIELELCRTSLGSVVSAMLLWDKEISFLEGGSQEGLELSRLDASVRAELRNAVTAALTMGLSEPSPLPGPPIQYNLRVTDQDGRPVSGADLLLIGADGVFLRASTNESGESRIGPTSISRITAFIAHPSHRASFVPQLGRDAQVEMSRSDGAGSMVCTRGWTSIPGLLGQVDLIHDAQGRTYIYGENVSINNGSSQPVPIAMGQHSSLKGANEASVVIVPRAVLGPCFLLDVLRA